MSAPATGCPKCGSIQIAIRGMAEAKLHAVLVGEDEDDPLKILQIEATGYCEWGDDTWAECEQCGHRAALDEFRPPDGPSVYFLGMDGEPDE